MIRHIKGSVAHIGDISIVVDVGGVGYLIYVNNSNSFKLDDTIKLHTYQAIRETTSDLYGFLSLDELDIFELLLGLPSIGPKSAAQILAQADIELLKTSVLNEDPAHLSKISGIGKKTAEKIVIGLKEKFENMGMVVPGASGARPDGQPSFYTDAIDALISLGYPQSDARKVVQQLPPEIQNTNEAVHAALKILGQN